MKQPDKFTITILSIAAAIAVLLSVLTYFSTNSSALSDLAGVVASPFRSVSAAVAGAMDGWKAYLTEFDALQEENQRLRRELAEKEAVIRQAELDREENARLRELADLRQQRRDLHFESARILVQDASNWSSLLTINKGTSQDIQAGNCVVTEEGYLIGVVTEAGLNWATVRTVVDSESSIGATVFRSGASALAQGRFDLMGENRLSLSYLGFSPDLASGDLVVTSGLGGYYPAQLVIGYVEEVRSSDDGLDQLAVVRPAADLEKLTQVFVITRFDIVDSQVFVVSDQDQGQLEE
ncbi:MAG: rod shape-determining protein MreC [Oscillospiraceae bacterium]|nr:rod shape-determining protein MreC [Oscillospiraceae bacterium]